MTVTTTDDSPGVHVTDPFRTPVRWSDYKTAVWIVNLTSWRPLFILTLLIPIGWLLHLQRLGQIQFRIKPMQRWVARLCEERQAVAMDRVVYLGGHPLLPVPEEAALFVCSADLRLELRSGRTINVPLSSLGTPQFYSNEQRGIFVTHQIAGMFVTSEILRKTEHFAELPFRDDKGFANTMKFACGNLIDPELLSNLIVSARYADAPEPAATPSVPVATPRQAIDSPTLASSERAALTQRLEHLRELRDKELITDDEFETKRREIIEGL
jgi:hypothetical protein